MCGIFGVINQSTFDNGPVVEKLVKSLFLLDTLRGPHASGLAIAGRHGLSAVSVYKDTLPGYHFNYIPRVQKMLGRCGVYDYVIAHNRWATVGADDDPFMAHPFVEDHITMVHNGTLFSHYDLADVTSDSHAICTHLSKHPYKETLEQLDGAFALVWYDAQENVLRFARNEERPMHFLHLPHQNIWLYGSSVHMLRAAAENNKIVYGEDYELPVGEVWTWSQGRQLTMEPFTVYHWAKPHGTVTTTGALTGSNTTRKGRYPSTTSSHASSNYTVEPLDKYNLKKGDEIEFYYRNMVFKTSKSRHGTLYGTQLKEPHHYVRAIGVEANRFQGRFYLRGNLQRILRDASGVVCLELTNILATTTPDPAYGVEKKEEEKQVVTDAATKVKGPERDEISIAEFEKLVSDGCVNCFSPLTPEDADSISWTTDGKPMCLCCVASIYSEDDDW